MAGLSDFKNIYFVDFEFAQPEGGFPVPVCMVAREYHTGRVIRLFGHEMKRPDAPFPTDKTCLFVAYYASAELGCFLQLDWPFPERILDLYVEFRRRTSGVPPPKGSSLLEALSFYGLDFMDSVEKEEMRQLAMRGMPYTVREREALLDYCQEDVDALARLLPRMLPHLDLPRALLRGRYMAAVARIEQNGTPIDIEIYRRMQQNWNTIKSSLIERLDIWRIWDGTSFRMKNFEAFLSRVDIPWPRTKTGRLALDEKTFDVMSKVYPDISTIKELRDTLSGLRLNDLSVGSDERNRCMLSAFRSKTGRNQPSNSKFIFGPSAWFRSLIKPSRGMALAYIDWEQQEFGIAAALSGDRSLIDAYMSGDPYLAFAIQANAVPLEATKDSHPVEREQFKVCALGVQYGMGAQSLALALGVNEAVARYLLDQHKLTYSTFWEWSQRAVDYANLKGEIHTVFGWKVHVGPNVNPRSLGNFPMQANGAEMLRLACCMATERGIKVCAPIHDAILIEAPNDKIDEAVAATQGVMQEASEIVLSGFILRTDVEIVRWPERYRDKRGEKMWRTVTEILDEIVGADVN